MILTDGRHPKLWTEVTFDEFNLYSVFQ